MRRARVWKPFALLSALALPALAGCGGGNLVRVTGQVEENGVPRHLGTGESIRIDFTSADNAPRPLSLGIFAKRDGSFVADMNDGSGRGIPPGQYKVKLNRESTSLKTKVNSKLFKESYPLEVVPGAPIHLTIDPAAGTIARP
jgi:hypothetical protein